MTLSARERFLALLHHALEHEELVKLTLGKPAGPDPTLQNLYVRPVQLKAGPRLAFVWRHATRDVTKNLTANEAYAALRSAARDPVPGRAPLHRAAGRPARVGLGHPAAESQGQPRRRAAGRGAGA